MNDIKHVAIYLRKSRNEENLSIEEVFANHKKTLLKICKQNKWKYETFEEVASSKNIARKQLNIMLDKVKENQFDAVVVMDVDRFSRDVFDAPTIFKVLHDSKTAIVTPSKFYSWDKEEDILLLLIQSLVAAQEYNQIKKRMTIGKTDASKKGWWTNGSPPLGYSKNDKTRKLEPNERAKDIKYIFNAIIEGRTVSNVVQELNLLGMKTAKGKAFTSTGVVRLVNNENYKGTIISNRTIGKHEAIRPESDWIVIPEAHVAIIDVETWGKANKIVNTPAFTTRRSKNRIYPTSKLIYCGNCGGLHSQQIVKGKLYLTICRYCKNRSYPYKPILESIKEKVGNYSSKILSMIEEVEKHDNTEEIIEKKKQIEKQIRIVKGALETIQEQSEVKDITRDEDLERKAKRTEQLNQLNSTLDKMNQETPAERIADLKTAYERVEYLLGNWQVLEEEGLTDEEVNSALLLVIERIEWTYSKTDEFPTMTIEYKQ